MLKVQRSWIAEGAIGVMATQRGKSDSSLLFGFFNRWKRQRPLPLLVISTRSTVISKIKGIKINIYCIILYYTVYNIKYNINII